MKTFHKNSILVNSLWLFFDKGYGALLTLYVYSLLAKYFKIELFGIWNYLIAFTAFLPAVSSLGLNFIIVKIIKERPVLYNAILINAFILRLFFGILSGLLLLLIFMLVGINVNQKYFIVIILLFLSQIFLNSNVFIFENEANLNNKKTVINRNFSLTICSVIRVIAINSNYDMLIFALINVIEYALFLWLSWNTSSIIFCSKHFFFNKKLSAILLKKGLPLMLSAVVVIIYLKIDQLIIAYLMDNKNVGIYSAASRISELFYAVPVIISNVYFPKIIEIKNQINQRNKMLSNMYAIIIVSTILIASIISWHSDIIIDLLYGKDYKDSVIILQVYSWSLLFMGLLVSSSKYLLVIERNDLILKRGLIGLVSNVLFNFIFIPLYGLVGAAYATLLSYFIASYVSNLFFKPLRPLIYEQLLAIYRSIRFLYKG